MRFLAPLFLWMKYYHITKNKDIYKGDIFNLPKLSTLFYITRILYPIWLFIGLFTGNLIFVVLTILGLIKYFIYPLIKGKTYRIYELTESVICCILYIMLLF
jgi:hypothetical protein